MTTTTTKNMINWFTIPCTDHDRAVSFYNTIFQITMANVETPDGGTCAFFLTPGEEGVGGGIHQQADQKPGKDGTIIYLNAEGVLDEVLGRVEAAGGKVEMPRTDIGDHGFIGMIEDSEGNRVGLHSMS